MPSSASVILSLQTAAAPQLAQLADGTRALTAAQIGQITAAQRLATANAQTAVSAQRLQTEEQRTAVQTANAAKAADQASGAALRLAQAQDKAGGSSSLAAQFADGLKSGLLNIVGPAALAAGAIGLLVGTANSFKEAFSFKAQLDQTTASIEVQLRGVRDSGAVFADAAKFADTYKLTQQDTTEAIRASLPVIRASKASTEDVLGVLSRLRVLNPEQDFAGAARALAELKAGQVTSIVDRFNIARSSANAMKKEIEGGGDAVLVLSKYLDSAGIGMDALKTGATGASGAVRDLAKAQEELKIAQGNIATSSAGIAVVEGTSQVFRGLANLLNGDVTSGIKSYAINAAAASAQQQVYTAAIQAGKTEVEATALGQDVFNKVLQASIDELDLLPASASNGSKALFDLIPAANAAADALDALNSKKVLPHLTDKGAIGAVGGIGALVTKGFDVVVTASKKADAEAAALQSANDALRLSRARTSAQKIAELQRQQAATSDPVEKIRLQTQIEQERNSAAKAHTGELNKQLRLNEGIYDSIAKQRDAALDIEELTIRDRQIDRADVAKKRAAEAILADPRKARFADAARDALALIDVQDRKRANELANKGATVAGSIVNGKLLQSVPGGSTAALPGVPGTRGAGTAPGAPGGAAGAAGAGVQVLVYLDGAAIAANVVVRMSQGLRQSDAAGGGVR